MKLIIENVSYVNYIQYVLVDVNIEMKLMDFSVIKKKFIKMKLKL